MIYQAFSLSAFDVQDNVFQFQRGWVGVGGRTDLLAK